MTGAPADWERRPGFELGGERALVVGFANPLGHELACTFAEAGAAVAAASGSLDAAEVDAAKLAAGAAAGLGPGAIQAAWDVTRPETVDSAFAALERGWGRPTVVLYNADLPLVRPVEQTSDAELVGLLQVNLQGAFATARAFLRRHPTGERGRLIFLTSVMGERGLAQHAAYAASKAGVVGMAQALAQEAGHRGVTVNCLSTGWMEWTPERGGDELISNLLLRWIPQRRFGRAQDVATLAVLLASAAGGFINGQVLRAEGGVLTRL